MGSLFVCASGQNSLVIGWDCDLVLGETPRMLNEEVIDIIKVLHERGHRQFLWTAGGFALAIQWKGIVEQKVGNECFEFFWCRDECEVVSSSYTKNLHLAAKKLKTDVGNILMVDDLGKVKHWVRLFLKTASELSRSFKNLTLMHGMVRC